MTFTKHQNPAKDIHSQLNDALSHLHVVCTGVDASKNGWRAIHFVADNKKAIRPEGALAEQIKGVIISNPIFVEALTKQEVTRFSVEYESSNKTRSRFLSNGVLAINQRP